jgi:hypothetical protein
MTAVEWLVEQLFPDNEFFGCSKDLLEQAKEMEKEQIIDAHNNGKSILPPNENGEQYYNETFKSE